MTLREMIIEYILFAFDDEDLMDKFQITEGEVFDLADEDLLEIYDKTLLMEIEDDQNATD